MADQLDLLRQLQTIDAELYRLKRALTQQPQQLQQAQVPLSAQEAAVKAVEERLKTLQLFQKEKEIDLQTREGNIKKLQSQLFQLKTNKDYTMMQKEIASIKADNSVIEEAILKGFDAIEEATQAKQQAQAKLQQEQAKFAAFKAQMDQQAAATQSRIGELELTRKALLPDVPTATLNIYERILALRDGLALVPLVKDTCGGCNRRMPPQVLNQALLKAVLVTCESCSRILFFDDKQSGV